MVRESETGYICNLGIYNSVSTSEILLKNKTRVCGAIRENRGLPNQLKEKSKNLQGRNDILMEGRSDSSMERQEASLHGDNYS